VNGTALQDGNPSARAAVAAAPWSPVGDLPTHQVRRPPTASMHVMHGLIAISNGPDYCLCGQTWPCEENAD
jgi:hypothetical protein